MHISRIYAHLIFFQPCNYQPNESIVHEIKFDGIAAMLIYIVTGVLILIGSLRCLKEAKLMDMIPV